MSCIDVSCNVARPRGLALASALWVGVLVLLFGLSLASLASYQFHNSTTEIERRQAYEAAQAGLSAAMDAIARDPKYGTHGETLSAAIGTSSYRVSFDASAAKPYSTNNLQGGSGVPGYASYVAPPYTALIFSSGTSPGGLQSVQVAVVQLQAYNYALAATGKVTAAAPVNVSGASSLLQYQSGLLDTRGDVYGGDSGVSVQLQQPSSITGEVRAVGTASVAAGSTVTRGVSTGVDPDSLPDIDISRYENSGMAGVVTIAPGSYLLPLIITGPTYVPGDLTLQSGADLVNGYLYVAGNLTVSGLPMTGTGSVFVQKKAQIANSLTLAGTTTIALYSQQQLTLTGNGFFQGLLYSHAGVHAQGHLTVIGGVYVLGGDIVLDQSVTVIYMASYLSFSRSFVSGGGTRADIVRLFWEELP